MTALDANPGEPSPLQAHADDLVAIAHAAIDHGLVHGAPPVLEVADHPPALRETRAAFVTLLDADGGLRGCIGSIEAQRPLAEDVSANAFAAAFRDPRFAPLTPVERPGLACRLSVLTPPEPLAFADERDLLARLEPGVDGVLIEAGEHRGTFLPAVWEQIPDAVTFWQTLKRKAGLAPDAFPADLVVYRYRAESIG
ncbi:MAG: AmmeMemoRadiSam system protein A [Halofilum sp. (in: g-proteobacteria)]|nr:AmmeMemoRadiSam system protein A [Halofilum sp. (in: g-proteobacteria)]